MRKETRESRLGKIYEYLARGESLGPHKGLVHGVLEDVLTTPHSVEAVWHPNSFMYLKLNRHNNSTLRLHIWSPDIKEYTGLGWPIHNHIWALTSYVVCGYLENHVYQVERDTAAPTHKLYKIEYDGRVNRLRATNTFVLCTTASIDKIAEGTVYRLAPDIFHSTSTPSDETIATFVLAEEGYGKNPQVLGDVEGAENYTMERELCSDEAVKQAISLVLQRISK